MELIPSAIFAAADLGKADERAFTTRGRTFGERLVVLLHSRRGSSSTVAACAMLVPKLAVMAWYGVDLNGRRSLGRVKGFSRMPSKSDPQMLSPKNHSVSRSPGR
jgi:hypothetical protein